MSAQCRSCDAPIRWELTERGKRIPLDLEPRPDGNLWVRSADRVVVAVTESTPADIPRFVSHFATCPDAADHRRPR